MSCSFDLHCLDCAGSHDVYEGGNWAGDRLLAALKYRAQLEAPGLFTDSTMEWFTDDAGRLGKLVSFFSAHVGHRLGVVSEYGQVYAGSCHKGHTGKGFCDLEEGHEGECHWPPRFNWNEVTRRYEQEKS